MVTYSRVESVRVLMVPYHIKPLKPNNSKNPKMFEPMLRVDGVVMQLTMYDGNE